MPLFAQAPSIEQERRHDARSNRPDDAKPPRRAGKAGARASANPPTAVPDDSEAGVRVLCVDDHAGLVEGLQAQFAIEGGIRVVGRLASADKLLDEVTRLPRPPLTWRTWSGSGPCAQFDHGGRWGIRRGRHQWAVHALPAGHERRAALGTTNPAQDPGPAPMGRWPQPVLIG
jgi:hypothetical protein